ncbi:MAG: transcription elongation factor GreA [Clostridia bacterium]|nr:transcription elongation factor GreA [Clostridia bacterium]
MAEEVYLTAEGKKELEERLKYLKTVRRAEITEKIKVARDFGDLSENAEYDAAKNEQSQFEGEIIEIEAKLKNAIIIDDSARHHEVKLGGTIVIKDEQGKQKTYQIVGTTEADPYSKPARISNESPIGSAAMGKKKGEKFTVYLPNGNIVKYTLVDIA